MLKDLVVVGLVLVLFVLVAWLLTHYHWDLGGPGVPSTTTDLVHINPLQPFQPTGSSIGRSLVLRLLEGHQCLPFPWRAVTGEPGGP